MQNLAGSTQPAEKPMCHEFAGKLKKLTSDPFMVNRLLKAFKALRDEDSQETILLTINTDLTEEADKEIQLQFLHQDATRVRQ